MGRKTRYTAKLARDICDLLAQGKSLRKSCAAMKKRGTPINEKTVRDWVIDDREGFAAMYVRARDMGLDVMADEVIEISDTPKLGTVTEEITDKDGTRKKVSKVDMVQHRRLQVDSRKWYLSKLGRKKYGDYEKVDANDDGDNVIKIEGGLPGDA